MNRKITFQDLREFDFRNVWELKNPKFAQAPEDSNEALPQFKRRHNGSVLGNYFTPSRLYGLRALLAWPLWLFIVVLVLATVYAYSTSVGEIGQVIFTLAFIAVYLLFFVGATKSRIQKWDGIYNRKIKTDTATHSTPTIIYDGRDMLMANARILGMIGERPIEAFVDDYADQLRHKEKLQADAKKQAEKEKARLRKEKEDREFKEALEVVGPLIGGGIKSLVQEGGVATRAARAARGTTRGDSLASRASRAARGTTISPPKNTKPNYVKIEGYTGSYWETCATGLENNSNYISTRLKQIRKSNPRYTKLRAVDSNGHVVDMG